MEGIEGKLKKKNYVRLISRINRRVQDGVGIRIRYGDNGGNGPVKGTSVTLNEPANLPVVQKVPASSAATAVPVNFMAQMVQTGSTVTAGRANGTATFVLEYN